MSEVWYSVDVYGPCAEIDRFKRLCFVWDPLVEPHDETGYDGCDCLISVSDNRAGLPGESSTILASADVQNFGHNNYQGPESYAFRFDSHQSNVPNVLRHIANQFPLLAIYCECIHAMDEFMGYGWFNAPAGHEEFRDDYQVPEDYWKGGGGCMRNTAAQLRHELAVQELIRVARGTGGDA